MTIARIARRWARSRGLHADFSERWPVHDWIHARFNLSIACEGIVLAIEEWCDGGPAPTLQRARTLALDSDQWTDATALEAFAKAPSILDEYTRPSNTLP